MRCTRCDIDCDDSVEACPYGEPQAPADDPALDYVVCLTCGFIGTVMRGHNCPDCIMSALHPMNPAERAGWEAGTLTHASCFEDYYGHGVNRAGGGR
jgi:hypothetical protein